MLTKIDVVAPLHRQGLGGTNGAEGFAWVEVLGQARANSGRWPATWR